MKKILIGVIYCILLNLTSNAQSDVPERAIPIGSPGGAVRVPGRLYIGEQVYLPIGTDLPGDSSMTRPGSLYNKKPLSSPYSDLYYWNGQTWVLLISGSTGVLEETDPVAVNKRITINGTTQILDSNPVFNIPPPDLTNYATLTQLATKVNIGDTANMLFPYQRKGNYVVTETDPVALPLIGTLSSLTTTAKTNLVSAINEVNGKTLSSLTLNGPGVIFSFPTTFTGSNGVWTGTMALNTQAPNTFFAGPGSGANATPTFRLMAAADVASGSGYYIQNQYTAAQASSNFWISGNGRLGGDLTIYNPSSSGNLYIGNAFSGGTILTIQGSTSGSIFTSAGAYKFAMNGFGTAPMQIFNSGNVSLNSNVDYGQKLQVGGGVLASGFYSPSTPAGVNNVAANGMNFAAGAGTGTGAGGAITFQTASAGAAGSTVNPEVTRMTIDGTGNVTLNGTALVLGNIATDPAGSNGMEYYNTTSGQFRDYRAGAWYNRLEGNDAILNQNASDQTANYRILGTGTITTPSMNATGITVNPFSAGNSAMTGNYTAISATANFNGSSGTNKLLNLSSTNNGGVYTVNQGYMIYAAGGSNNLPFYFTVAAGGNVSIGRNPSPSALGSNVYTNTNYPLYVVSSMTNSAAYAFGQNSGGYWAGRFENTTGVSDPTASLQTKGGLDIYSTGTVTSATNNAANYGIRIAASGSYANYAIYASSGMGYFADNVGIGVLPNPQKGMGVTRTLTAQLSGDVLAGFDINSSFTVSTTGISTLNPTFTSVGTGYNTFGTFPATFTGGTGTGATGTITIDANRVPQSFTLTNGGTGYTVGDVLTISTPAAPSSTATTVTVTAVGYSNIAKYALRLNDVLGLGGLSADPTVGVEGMIYRNTTTNTIRVYLGGAWKTLTTQ